MDDTADKKAPRTPPGAPFFIVAMAFYLLLVHGTSLIGAGAGLAAGPPQHYPGLWPWLDGLLNALGGTARSSALVALPLLYGSMVCTFFLTRALVPGPIWLGSVAGTCLMAHPAKTEILFGPTGLYYCLATFLALAATLAFVRIRTCGPPGPYALAVALFACASLPFAINSSLILVFLLLMLVGDRGGTAWLRLIPFALIALAALWLHREHLFTGVPSPSAQWAPLLLLVYPIGLLPETVAELSAAPWQAWLWGLFAAACVSALGWYVKSTPFRIVLCAIVVLPIIPTGLPIDLVTLAGGGQLFFSAALFGIALAAFSAWLMRFDAWGQPTVALTTLLCGVLFVLQFQANRACIQRLGEVPEAPPAALSRSIAPPESEVRR